MPERTEVNIQLPAFAGSIEVVYTDAHGQKTIHDVYDGDIPKEIMDAYEALIGNGFARVSVGQGLGIKEYGTGADAMVNVTLTCNQDQNTINSAIDLAGKTANWWAKKWRQDGASDLEKIQQGIPT